MCSWFLVMTKAVRWLVSFCTFGLASSFGVFEAYYVGAGASSSSNISWIGSLQVCDLFGCLFCAL